MEVDWDSLHLPKAFLNSREFRDVLLRILLDIWPIDGITTTWARYYDIWHRHLIPLSDFMITPEEAIVKFGLLHYSGDEDPKQLEIYYREREIAQVEARRELEKRVNLLNEQIGDPQNSDNLWKLELELSDAQSELNQFVDEDIEERIRSAYEDEALRNNLLRVVGDRKDDPRRYVMIHHCFDNAKTIYLMMENLFPDLKWTLILAPGHALITTGSPEQLETYLFHDSKQDDFWIAEPVVSGREAIAKLMVYPERWRWFTKKKDIMSYSRTCTL